MHPARAFALGAHLNQKYGNKPYIYHLDSAVVEVEGILGLPLFRFHDKSTIVSATYLHDILEDTGCQEDTLLNAFGPLVTEIVKAVTDCPGKNRDEKKAGMYVKVQQCGETAMAVKLADRIANVKHCVESNDKGLLGMYRKEHEHFKGMLYIAEMDPIWVKLGRIIGLGE